MFRRISHIAIGWSKKLGLMQTSNAEEKLSALRVSICMRCEHQKKSGILEILEGNVVLQDTIVCKKCSCPCVPKSFVVDEKCPVGKW